MGWVKAQLTELENENPDKYAHLQGECATHNCRYCVAEAHGYEIDYWIIDDDVDLFLRRNGLERNTGDPSDTGIPSPPVTPGTQQSSESTNTCQ